MPEPTTTLFRVTSPGTTYSNVLARFNTTGGPQGVQIGAGASGDDTVQRFGNILGGQWGVPLPMVFQFDDSNTASDLRYRLRDNVSQLEDFFPGGSGDYDFRIKLNKDYVDPTTYTSGNLATWATLPHGISTTGYSFDTNRPNPGNDGSSNMIIAHNSVTGRYLLNFWVYIVFKPQANATAGAHNDWGFRFNYVYS